eukprot:JP447188.1.p2 GENE.JP447188.1~~JP447188.1.p2  ORF type:complete len:107 (-),score=5.85 JP447188.1:117-437(-)
MLAETDTPTLPFLSTSLSALSKPLTSFVLAEAETPYTAFLIHQHMHNFGLDVELQSVRRNEQIDIKPCCRAQVQSSPARMSHAGTKSCKSASDSVDISHSTVFCAT